MALRIEREWVNYVFLSRAPLDLVWTGMRISEPVSFSSSEINQVAASSSAASDGLFRRTTELPDKTAGITYAHVRNL